MRKVASLYQEDVSAPLNGVAFSAQLVFGGSLPAMIWGAFNAAYHAGLEPLTFEPPEWTRAGTRIRTDQEEDDYRELIESFCGVDNEDAEIDTDEDGVVDYCDPEKTEFEFDEGIGDCPMLFEPVDADEDGEVDGCTPPTTTTSTTTLPPTTTTLPPTTTTLPPTTTTGDPATTTSTTTTSPPTTTTQPPTS